MAGRTGKSMKKLILAIISVFLLAGTAYGAGDIKPKYGSNTAILGTTASKTTLTGTIEIYTSVVDLGFSNDYEGALVSIYLEESGAATSGAGVSVWYTADAYAESISGVTYETPNISFETADIDASGATKTFLVTDAPYFFIGIHEITAADGYSAAIYYLPWFWQYTQLFFDIIEPPKGYELVG